MKSYTNRFGLQVSRTIVGCSWCKTAYHLKCFTDEEHKVECTFGDHSQLMVPPSWIVKSSNKNVMKVISFGNYYFEIKSFIIFLILVYSFSQHDKTIR
jgi:hypothetical protein